MTEEEKMKFWGELLEPIFVISGGLLTRGKDKLLLAFRDIVAKAETAALEEREACAKLCEESDRYRGEYFAQLIRARGQE